MLVVIWNLVSPWKPEWWGTYFFVVYLGVPVFSAAITTVWFFGGGLIDLRRLFVDLAARVDNPLDNGQVDGEVSLADQAVFSEREKKDTDSAEKK